MEDQKKGIVISIPIEFSPGSQILIKRTGLDPQEIRFLLLFWDEFVWPISKSLRIGTDNTGLFLQRAGILTRPPVPEIVTREFGSSGMAEEHVATFLKLEEEEPGKWALAQGNNSFIDNQKILNRDDSALVSLYRAIPVPNIDVPLQDIIEFRNKRKPELISLRTKIDSFYSLVENAENQDEELSKRIKELDSACEDLFRVNKEKKWKFKMSDLNLTCNLEAMRIAGGWTLGGKIGEQINMPLIGEIAGAIVSTIKITKDVGLKVNKSTSDPYLYVTKFHREVFNE